MKRPPTDIPTLTHVRSCPFCGGMLGSVGEGTVTHTRPFCTQWSTLDGPAFMAAEGKTRWRVGDRIFDPVDEARGVVTHVDDDGLTVRMDDALVLYMWGATDALVKEDA